MIFEIDFNKLVRKLTPPFLRKEKTTLWMRVLFTSIKVVYSNLLVYRDQKEYELSITSQTIVLESHLNDLYDDTQRRIKIIHADPQSEFDYFESEGQSADFDYFESEGESARYLYFIGENTGGIASDFIVVIPISLAALESQIAAVVNKYRLAGAEFAVQQT